MKKILLLIVTMALLLANGYAETDSRALEVISDIQKGVDNRNAIEDLYILNDAHILGNLKVDGVSSQVFASGSISNSMLAQNSVHSLNIINGTVSNVDLAQNSVHSLNIIAGTISNLDLADNCINSAQIVDGQVEDQDLDADSVSSNAVIDGEIGGAELRADAVTTDKIMDNQILNADLASNCGIDGGKFADNIAITNGIYKGRVVYAYNSAIYTNEQILPFTSAILDISAHTNGNGSVTTNYLPAPGTAMIGATWTLVNSTTNLVQIGAGDTLLPASAVNIEDQYDSMTVLGFSATKWILLNTRLND